MLKITSVIDMLISLVGCKSGKKFLHWKILQPIKISVPAYLAIRFEIVLTRKFQHSSTTKGITRKIQLLTTYLLAF